jgi:CheY-like chemotaxis protein
MLKGSKHQILVVDDDPSIRESLTMLLKSVGYDVSMAESGISALSLLNIAQPDLIVTDINMPKMSGLELISHVRAQYPSVSVIAMSGDFDGEAMPAGVIGDWFYPKNQHPHKLLNTIASLIARGPRSGGNNEQFLSSADSV